MLGALFFCINFLRHGCLSSGVVFGDGAHQVLFAGAADPKGLAAQQNLLLPDARDKAEIDQIALVAPAKAVALYTLFNNLMDNAIDAVESLPENRRVISLSVRRENGATVIDEENYFSGPLRLENGNVAVPRGSEAEGHGFGLKSIRMIAEQYGGSMTLQAEDDVFSVRITLPDMPA